MDKQQTLELVRSQLAAGSITREELLALATQGASASLDAPALPHRNLINVFYALGGLIVLIGVIILVAQYWDDIGYLGRLLVTLGIAIASVVAGTVMRLPSQRVISQVFFALGAALFPLGAYVVFTENGMAFTLTNQLIVSAGLAVLFGIAWLFNRRNALPLFVIGYATWAYYALLLDVLDITLYSSELLKWATIVAGLAYVFLGVGYRGSGMSDEGAAREARSVRTILYGLGTFAALLAGILLSGVWDLVYLPFVFGFFYASVYVKSRAMLVFAALFLAAHLVHLTAEYFADSIGWPIALVIIGFLIIGVGYGTYYIGRRYIKS